MVKVLLPSHLAKFLEDDSTLPLSKPVLVSPCSWEEFVRELRARHPRLAEKVFVNPSRIASGFALVVNDEIVQGNHDALHFRSGDEMCILATFAGG